MRTTNVWTTSVVPLGNGKYGARVLRDGKLVAEDNSGTSRANAAANLRELLRWVAKRGYECSMASASRARQKP